MSLAKIKVERLDIPSVNDWTSFELRCIRLMDKGRMIHAITLYRLAANVGLKIAYDYLRMLRGNWHRYYSV